MKHISILFIILVLLITSEVNSQLQYNTTTNPISEALQGIMEDYAYLHANPELSFLEKETAEYLARKMEAIGFEVHTNVGGHGLVCILKNGNGPTVMLRTDIDALPVKEETGSPFASEVRMVDITGDEVPVMHACGHDVHMSTWLGTASVLHRLRDSWSGTLILIGQPAEERGAGSRAMLSDQLYSRFGVPDYALAMHVNATLPSNSVGYCHGYALANVDMMDITVFGQGGHGAYPHTAIDPVVLSAQLILDLQTIVSREVSPLEPAVVTVGAINGGTKGNVIPDKVELKLTLRSYTSEVREQLIKAIERKCRAAAEAAGLREDKYPVVTLRDEETPAVYNDPELGKELVGSLQTSLGPDRLVEVMQVMGGEDFARYGRTEEKVPIYLFWVGAVSEGDFAAYKEGQISLPPLHSPRFLPDAENTIRTGMELMVHSALHLFQKGD